MVTPRQDPRIVVAPDGVSVDHAISPTLRMTVVLPITGEDKLSVLEQEAEFLGRYSLPEMPPGSNIFDALNETSLTVAKMLRLPSRKANVTVESTHTCVRVTKTVYGAV